MSHRIPPPPTPSTHIYMYMLICSVSLPTWLSPQLPVHILEIICDMLGKLPATEAAMVMINLRWRASALQCYLFYCIYICVCVCASMLYLHIVRTYTHFIWFSRLVCLLAAAYRQMTNNRQKARARTICYYNNYNYSLYSTNAYSFSRQAFGCDAVWHEINPM